MNNIAKMCDELMTIVEFETNWKKNCIILTFPC